MGVVALELGGELGMVGGGRWRKVEVFTIGDWAYSDSVLVVPDVVGCDGWVMAST